MAARKRGRQQRRRPAARSRASGRKRAKARRRPNKRARSSARRTTTRRTAARKATRKAPSRPTARKAARRRAAPKRADRPAAKSASRPAARRTSAAARTTPPAVPEPARRVPSTAGGLTARAKAPLGMSRGKSPRLERERRILSEPEREETPAFEPDARMLQSARTGRDELRQALRDHTETGPELTGGDIDANWQDAYAVGDEAPGGDNPTPDQDRVDDIGRSLGVTYDDNEELKGADKIAERDRKRWEFDPASSDDWPRKE